VQEAYRRHQRDQQLAVAQASARLCGTAGRQPAIMTFMGVVAAPI
jgi:hypothetical protein